MSDALATPQLDQLRRSLAHAQEVVRGIGPDQVSLPTPCASWNVSQVVNHMIDDTRGFTDMVNGATYERHTLTLSPDEWEPALQRGGEGLLQAWEAQDIVRDAQRFQLGLHITEFCLHAWDVAKATGQPTELDPDLAGTVLAWGRVALKPEQRGDEAGGKAFGLEVPVREDASVTDRLVAFFGRSPF